MQHIPEEPDDSLARLINQLKNQLKGEPPVYQPRISLRQRIALGLLALLLGAAILCAWLRADAAVSGEWRVNLLRGSTTVQPYSSGATEAAAWQACQARIPRSAPAASYTCQTPRYVASVTPDPPPVDCAVSAWSAWSGDAWSLCASATQTRQETRSRTVATSPANGGIACPELSETRTATQPCVTPDTQPPSMPSLTATAVSASRIDLQWTAATDNVGVVGYVVHRCLGAACTNFTLLPAVPDLTMTRDALVASTAYRYRVHAIDAAGNQGAPSAIASATTLPAAPPPAGTATLSWMPPTQNMDGSALTNLAGYRIHYGTGAGGEAYALDRAIDLTNPALRTYVVTGLTSGTWYFAVRALTASGQSDLSNVATKIVQ